MEKKYFDTVETAKLIRKALKAKFPGVKFSVRSRKYAGGSSIDVVWTDGPAAKAVDKKRPGVCVKIVSPILSDLIFLANGRELA